MAFKFHTPNVTSGLINYLLRKAGATELYQSAKNLEDALKERRPDLAALLEDCERAHECVLQSIATLKLTPALASAKPAAPVDVAALAPLVARLRALLQEDDMEAVDVVAALLAQTRGTGLAESVQSIETALGQYDFEGALNTLERLAL